MLKKIKKLSKWQIIVISFFLIIFFIGLFTFKDYGMSEDERLQRNHSLINNYYLRCVLAGDFQGTGSNLNDKKMNNLEKIMNDEFFGTKYLFSYPYKYYGVAIQMPLTFIEQIFNYQLDVRIIFLIRHFYTFLIFFLSLIYFYKLLEKYIVKNKKIALIGVLFLVLSPRIYGESFYNIKDNVFMSLCIINLYYSFKYLNTNSEKNVFLFCFSSALTINSRVIGGIILLVTSIFKIFLEERKQESKKTIIKKIIILYVITYYLYIFITPASWYNVFTFPINVIKFFFNYSDPMSKQVIKSFYFGKLYDSTSLPWHYLPVQIFISTPILYIILSLIGFISKIKVNIKNKIKKIDKELLLCNIILFSILFFVMIVRPTTYCGWRHFYFLYPIIIINATIGLKRAIEIKKIKKVIIILITFNSLILIWWMIKNHPYQYNYYSLINEKYYVENFGTNYVRLSNSEALEYIAKYHKENILVYCQNYIPYYLLNKSDRNRIGLTNDKDKANYIIDNNSRKGNINPYKYKELFYKEMDGYRLYTIYERIK